LLKFLYIHHKTKIQPYKFNSIKVLILIALIYFFNSFLNFDFLPIADIIVRSLIIIFTYLMFIYLFGLAKSLKIN